MAKFDPIKVQWNVGEIEAADDADEVWEVIALYVKEHPNFAVKDIPGLLLALAPYYARVAGVISFVWSANLRTSLDRLKDLIVMLERDNDWLDQRSVE